MTLPFTVVGIYTEPFGQRFATCVIADTARQAEQLAVAEADSDLIVAGVIEGDHAVVDVEYTDGIETYEPEEVDG